MDFLAELLVAALIFIGGFFAFVGSYGLVKLPDTMSRLHTPTKTTTLGVGAILLASMAFFLLFERNFSIHELLITIFLFIAAPLSANMVSAMSRTRSRMESSTLATSNVGSRRRGSGYLTTSSTAMGRPRVAWDSPGCYMSAHPGLPA